MLKDDPKAAKEAFTAESKLHCRVCGVKHRSKTPEQCLDEQMSEKTLQDRVVDRAKRRGWKVAHAGRGIAAFDKDGNPLFVTQMAKGWPDLYMMRESDGRTLVIELKREKGEPDEDQLAYLQLFIRCGIAAVVVKPSDLREGRVNAILK